MFMVKLDDYGFVGIVNVPKDGVSLLTKAAGGDNPGHSGPGDLEAHVALMSDEGRIDSGAFHMGKGNLQPRPERPELVRSLYYQHQQVTFKRYCCRDDLQSASAMPQDKTPFGVAWQKEASLRPAHKLIERRPLPFEQIDW